MTTLSELILKIVSKASAMQTMSEKDIFLAARKATPEFDPKALKAALETLTNSRVLATCRITRDDITQDTYWPTGLRNPVLIGAPMSNSNTSASKLLRAIVLHGPITGADLAMKSGIPAKSIDSLLESATTRDAVTSRRGFCAEKGRELKHYMTTTQAAEWDARDVAADRDAHYAGHVMSAPDVAASAKQSDGEIPVNEIDEDITPDADPCGFLDCMSDAVNHPPHYTAGGIECIDAIESALTPEEFRGYCKGNALKYIWRERLKGGDESLAKASWYMARMNSHE